MSVDFMLRAFRDHADQDAVIWRDITYSYSWLLDRIDHWRVALRQNEIAGGTVVIL